MMPSSTSYTLQYGSTLICYELCRMPRKSLEIAVHPDQKILVKAPLLAPFEMIEKRIKKRALWIKKQLAFFEQFSPRTPERQYVGGESHLYLGRKYRLKISSSNENSILLKNGYFFIEATQNNSLSIKNILDAWYYKHALIHFSEIFEKCWAVFQYENLEKPTLKLQKMKTRWGSLSKSGQLTLNTYLIKTPKECIEYVIIHELCHLKHHNHSQEFYELLSCMMPDWVKRKHKLEVALA